MQNDILTTLARLSDADLVQQVKTLVARDRDVGAELVAHLAELDTRDVHLREGYPSLYVYCRDALGLSEWEAYNRIEVARAARRFPVILEMLASGAVNLTAVRLLAPHLTPENHREALESARGKKKPEVEAIVARLAPRRDVPCVVRRIPTHLADAAAPVPVVSVWEDSATENPLASLEESLGASSSASQDPTAISGAAVTVMPIANVPVAVTPIPSVPVSGMAVSPLSPDRYKLQLTIDGETLDQLRLAQDMLGHSLPSGDPAAVLKRALTALLVDLAKKKFADSRKPRRSNARKPGAGVPSAAVKRAVWLRDLGRCAFVGTSGHRCGARRFVEFHHVDPYALGGGATVEGIQLRCRRHNDYEGRLYLGKRRRRRELVLEQVELSPSRSTA